MIAVEILGGLPSYGPPVLPFPADSSARYSEGLVVRFGAGDDSWTGNFFRGMSSFDWVGPMPDGSHVLVISHGAGYVIDPGSRTLVEELGGGIAQVLTDEKRELLILEDPLSCRIEAIGPKGRVWETGRITWDGFRGLRIHNDEIVGEAYEPWEPYWVPFSVNIETGAVSGGAKV